MRRFAAIARAQLGGAEAGAAAAAPVIFAPSSAIAGSSVIVNLAVRLNATGSSGTHKRTFQPFSKRDEDDLVRIISTRPRHVLKHVRQQVWRSRKKELHFRNTVTQLMIVVQDFLRKGLLDPQHASNIMDGVLEECVKLSQHDMAHLLFRAFVRFRKYGCTINVSALRHLFESYKGTDNVEMMLQLAVEMQSDPDLRPFCIAAYLFARRPDEAEALRAKIPLADVTAHDVQGMIEGYGKLNMGEKVLQIIDELPALNRAPEELTEIFRSALRVFFKKQDDKSFDRVFQAAVKLRVPFDTHMFATVLRMRVRNASSLDEIAAVEEDLKALGYIPDMTGNSIVIAAMARLSHFGDRGSEEVMLAKVDTLLSSVESRLQQGDPDMDISAAHVRAVIRGYGAAGRPEKIKAAWGRMQFKGISNDTRVYNELLKWFSLMGNVKDVLQTKEEMRRNGVNADAHTYSWLFRALGKWYPRQVEQLYQELTESRVRPDISLYTTLIGVFGDLERFDRVEDIVAEIHRREAAGTLQISPLVYAVLMRVYNRNLERVEELFKEAQEKGVGNHQHVVTTMLHAYSMHPDGQEKLEEALKTLPSWDTNVFNVLLNMHGRRNNPDKVKELLDRMKRENVEFNDVTFGTLVTAFGRWKDTTKVHEVIEMLKEREGQVSANFYSILAATYNRMGDKEGINEAWEDLQQSKLFPDTEVYNQFLNLYSRRHDVAKMKKVMNSMMQQVPPNPLTATTVVDMLGKAGRISEMEALFEDMTKNPDTSPTSVTYHQMMNAYAKSGDVTKMERMREEMLSRGFAENQVTFNILADGYGRAKRFEQLGELIKRRRESDVPVDELWYSVLITAFARVKLVQEVNNLVDEIVRENRPGVMTRKVVWALIDAFTRCNDVAKMQEWVARLQAMPEYSSGDRLALIAYYCRLGMMDRVEEETAALEREKIDLSFGALNAIARGYARTGQFEKVVKTLHTMRDRQLVPDSATALALSNAFVRAGLHEQAQQVVQWRKRAAVAQPYEDSDDRPVV